MSTRITVVIDLVPDTLEHAYADLYRAMTKTGLDWQSTDEWFGVNNEPIDPETAQKAKMEAFRRFCGPQVG